MTPSEKLTTIAENIPKVFEAGKRAEYDAFWDAYQCEITDKNCDFLFAGRAWTKETCVPKYDVISPASAYMMFSLNPAITDMREFKKANGEKVRFDFSGTKDMTYCFYRTNITYIETVDCTTSTNLGHMFNLSPALETVELLKLKADGKNTLSSTFLCSGLKNITIEGTIGYNGTNFSSPLLTRSSIASIIGALSETTDGYKLTLKKAAVVDAFESVEDDDWQALIASKPNWTISLA